MRILGLGILTHTGYSDVGAAQPGPPKDLEWGHPSGNIIIAIRLWGGSEAGKLSVFLVRERAGLG